MSDQKGARERGSTTPTAIADGLRIDYAEAGGGDGLPLLCLTGWCSSRGRYERFLPLASRSRRVVALDWRGHGGSDSPAGDFGAAEMVRDAEAVVDAAGLGELAVASASHSGWIALELRRRLGERVRGVVHMDWIMFEPSAEYLALLRTLQEKDGWQEARDTLFRVWRGGLESPAIEQAVAAMNEHGAEMWIRSGREIEASFAAHRSPLAAWSELESPPPVLHLYGQPRDDAVLARQEEFAAESPWFSVLQVPARSHFSMLETPSETVEAIDAFLAG